MPRSAVLAAVILAACFFAGLVIAPLLEASGVPGAYLLRDTYAPLCHQIPVRSLTLSGRPLAVCARCVGLYGGGISGLLLAWFFPLLGKFPGWRSLAIALFPSVADAAARLMGWPGVSNGLRLLLTLPGGFVAGLLLAEGIADLAVLVLPGQFGMAESVSQRSTPGRP